MGIAMEARKWWAVRSQDMSTAYTNMSSPAAIPLNTAKQCSYDGLKAGAKAAAIACIASAVPMLVIPWARAKLNYAAQAHIISLATGAAYFIVADKTILAAARKNSFEKLASNVEVEPFLYME